MVAQQHLFMRLLVTAVTAASEPRVLTWQLHDPWGAHRVPPHCRPQQSPQPLLRELRDSSLIVYSFYCHHLPWPGAQWCGGHMRGRAERAAGGATSRQHNCRQFQDG